MFFIGLLISTALYGIICLLVCIFGLKIEIALIIQQALSPMSLTGYFYAYMFWSIILFPITILIDFIGYKISCIEDRQIGVRSNPFSSILGGTLFNCIINPFKGLFALVGARKIIDVGGAYGAYCWAQVITHFVWSIIIIAWVALNFIIIIR